MQSWSSDITFSDNLQFSGYFEKDHFSIYYIKSFHLVTFRPWLSNNFFGDQKCHYIIQYGFVTNGETQGLALS